MYLCADLVDDVCTPGQVVVDGAQQQVSPRVGSDAESELIGADLRHAATTPAHCLSAATTVVDALRPRHLQQRRQQVPQSLVRGQIQLHNPQSQAQVQAPT